MSPPSHPVAFVPSAFVSSARSALKQWPLNPALIHVQPLKHDLRFSRAHPPPVAAPAPNPKWTPPKKIKRFFSGQLFKKQVDKLQTDHQGTFVLKDSNFRWTSRYAEGTAVMLVFAELGVFSGVNGATADSPAKIHLLVDEQPRKAGRV